MPWRANTATILVTSAAGVFLSAGTWILCGLPGEHPLLSFFSLFAIFVEQPLWAFPVAAALAIFWLALRKRLSKEKRDSIHAPLAFSAFCWLMYGFYEMRMNEWSKHVTAPIRIDLLLIYPFLAAITLCALALLILSWRAVEAA